MEKDALFYRPRGGSSWERIIEVCHALPEGIQL